ncbi:MAG: hypothetical protein EXQ77_04170 [Thermoleophilia bacterium]|nr:hypothetical protein [Thermoleophilia bacterium]
MIHRPVFAALAACAALAAPALARAEASLTVHELPLGAKRSLAAVSAPGGFHYVGLHWRGPGGLELRVRNTRGTWGPWLPVDADSAPDPGTPEALRADGWRQGEGIWTGAASRLQVRAIGRVTRARAFTVASPVSRVPRRRLAAAEQPGIVSRAGWSADETIVHVEPGTALSLRLAVIHHTAGKNDYTREQAPAVVRAIQLYHVQGNGWADIGYNALVDRFGTVYEGRTGGLDRNVVGAHAKGFNTGSFGIALIGEFTTAAPPPEAVDALVRTLAWRLDVGHVDALASLTALSGGNEKFAVGVPVVLRAISSHRDTGSTACPGDQLYGLLPSIAERVGALGLPKLYDPVVTANPGEPVSFTARLSSPLPWTLTLVDGAGAVTVAATGEGTEVAVTVPLPPEGTTTWRIEAPGALAATGTLASASVAVVPTAEGLMVDPATIAPDGDGTLDATLISFTLPFAANVAVSILDAAGAVVAELEAPRWRGAGRHEVSFDGLGLPDGPYTIRVLARTAAGETAATVPMAITRTLRGTGLVSTWLSPNGDGRNERLGVRFTLAAPADVKLRIERDGLWIATPFSGLLPAGTQLVEWDGAKRIGRIREGSYTAVVEANDGTASLRIPLAFGADWTAPRVRLISRFPLLFRVSEPGTLRVKADGLRWTVTVEAPGEVAIPLVARPRKFAATATDAAGNVSIPLRAS